MYSEQTNPDEAQHPLVTYTNRLQRQFLVVTSLIYEQNARPHQLKVPLLGIIANLPPEGQKALTTETTKLLSNDTMTPAEINVFYTKIHEWAYEHLFKEAFALAKPRSQQTARIGFQ